MRTESMLGKKTLLLSPLSHKHFDMLGRNHFTVPDEVLKGGLRPLRLPEEADKELQIA
jgi:hypothetical protein